MIKSAIPNWLEPKLKLWTGKPSRVRLTPNHFHFKSGNLTREFLIWISRVGLGWISYQGNWGSFVWSSFENPFYKSTGCALTLERENTGWQRLQNSDAGLFISAAMIKLFIHSAHHTLFISIKYWSDIIKTFIPDILTRLWARPS